MPFNVDLVGQGWGPFAWEVTPRRALAFRAALAPDDATGLDDAAPEGLFALPMMIVSPEWRLALEARADPRQTLTDAEARQAVHASQDTRFLRRVKAGDALETRAEVLGARASRAGAIVATRFTSRDARSGETAAETISLTIYRGVDLSGPDAGASIAPPAPPEGPGAGVSLVPVGAGFPHVYSECAEIWNPIHTERQVAQAAGLSDIIVHGTAIWALAGLAAAARTPGGPMGITRLAARFGAPAYPGKTFAVEHGAGGGFQVRAPEGEVVAAGLVEFD